MIYDEFITAKIIASPEQGSIIVPELQPILKSSTASTFSAATRNKGICSITDNINVIDRTLLTGKEDFDSIKEYEKAQSDFKLLEEALNVDKFDEKDSLRLLLKLKTAKPTLMTKGGLKRIEVNR